MITFGELKRWEKFKLYRRKSCVYRKVGQQARNLNFHLSFYAPDEMPVKRVKEKKG